MGEIPGEDDLMVLSQGATFDDPFKLFSLVHKITDNVEAVSIAIKDVIADFSEDGVRLGHATALHPKLGGSEELWEEICLSKIPVEVCMTSNLTCKTVNSSIEHQAGLYHEAGVP